MLKRILSALASAARELLRRWGALLVVIALYLAMLGAVYLFFVTREETIGQLLVSLLLVIAAPVLFFIIQTMAARFQDEGEHAWRLLGRSARDFWKLLAIAIPLILIAVVAVYLFGEMEPSAPAAAVRGAVRSAPSPMRAGTPKPQPVSWGAVAIATLKYLLFYLVLPLAAIHLWIATSRDGLKQSAKGSLHILARAFAPQAAIAYAIGFVFFAVIPYFLIVTKTPVSSAWLDAGLLAGRLLLAALFSLVGWVVTLGALAQLGIERTAPVVQSNEGHVSAEA